MEGTGYSPNTFSFSAITNDTTNTVEVYAAVSVKFVVVDKLDTSLYIEGATVVCGGKSGTTNRYGECTLLLSKGTLDYSVTDPDYYEYKGQVTVGTSAMTVNVQMNLNPERIKPEENGNIQMMLTGTSCSISVSSPTANYVIDWGDDTTENASGTGYKSYSHTYGNSGFHQMEVRNCRDITSCMGFSSNLIAYWSIGDSKVSNITFSGCSKLIYFGKDVFKNDTDRTDASSLLYNCPSLTSVDLTPLASWVNVTSCEYLLSSCTKLTSVDLTPLASWVNVTNCGALLYNCRSLTSVDLTPLASWVKLTDNSSLLSSCRNLAFVSVLFPTPFPLSSGALTNGNNCPIYVPDDAVDTYKMATNWSAYASRIKPISEKTES